MEAGEEPQEAAPEVKSGERLNFFFSITKHTFLT